MGRLSTFCKPKTLLRDQVFYNNKTRIDALIQIAVVQPILRSEEILTEKENLQADVVLTQRAQPEEKRQSSSVYCENCNESREYTLDQMDWG